MAIIKIKVLIIFKILSYLCCFGFPLHKLHTSKFVKVHTNLGDILGKVKTVTFDGNSYSVQEFLGIPYAEPPVGNSRFRKPIVKAPFASPFTAFSYGPSCLQLPFGKMTLSEDCLYLNIFVPQNSDGQVLPLPVMVWIHGGGFVAGTSTMYPGENLSAFGQVIVVTMNYRLGYLGFLWTNEDFNNFGLWDQQLAIKWVSDNIAAFGGDRGRITIFGESAGSTSVVYQALYPGNKELFQRAIAQSGGITSPWGFASRDSANAAFDSLTREIGCEGNHSQLMTCLRSKTSREVERVLQSANLNSIQVIPNQDNDFIPQDPRLMLSHGTVINDSLDFFHSLDFMMGGNSIDGALYLSQFASILHITDFEKLQVTRNMYETYIIPMVLSLIFNNIRNSPQFIKDATVFEYTNWSCPDNYLSRNFMLINLMTDAVFFAPMVAMVRLHSNGNKGPSYLYELSAGPKSHLRIVPSWLDGPTQANHADDVMYVFGYPDEMVHLFRDWWTKFEFTSQDIVVSKAIMTMWTNFAKTG